MAYRVHALAKQMQAPGLQTVPDGGAPKPEARKLRLRHNTVLPRGDIGDYKVNWLLKVHV